MAYFCPTGLMADSLGSYTHAFYMAGAVVIAGAYIPFLLLCIKKREPARDRWATLGPNEELAEAPDWRRSIVYMIEDKATWFVGHNWELTEQLIDKSGIVITAF